MALSLQAVSKRAALRRVMLRHSSIAASNRLLSCSRGFAVDALPAGAQTYFPKVDHSKLKIEKTTQPKKKSALHTLVFGRELTDHMLEIDWKKDHGWTEPRIVPLHNLSLSPACNVFHYGAELFEGLKAYKDSSGKIRLFRADKNFERLNISAKRIALPSVDPESGLECLKALLRLERDWIPSEKGFSLYIRPTLIGTHGELGVAPSTSAKFFVVLSPVGPYYPEGWKAVKLLADDKYVRAWPGGTGFSKIGGNYAMGIMPQTEAAAKGYSQVLWLFGEKHYITEVGTMNFMLFWTNAEGQKELITAPLDGTILAGVTRDSALQITRQWNEFKVTERPYHMGELIQALNEGRVHEAFGVGTAAVVSPVKLISYKGKEYTIPLDKKDPNAAIGPLAKRLADSILAIQYGEVSHPWSTIV